MSELEEKLSAVLNDPSAMSQIMALAQSLSGGGREPHDTPEYAPVQDDPGPAPADGPGDPGALLGDVDPRMVELGMRLLREYGRGDDRTVALLTALRPFVKEERFAKMDRAIRAARLTRVVRVLLETLRGREGSQGV